MLASVTDVTDIFVSLARILQKISPIEMTVAMMVSSESDAQRWAESWSEGVNQQLEQSIQLLGDSVDRSVTVSSLDGSIGVRLDGAGMLTSLVFDEQTRSLRPDELAADVLATIQTAYRELSDRVRLALEDPDGATLTSQHPGTGVEGGWHAW